MNDLPQRFRQLPATQSPGSEIAQRMREPGVSPEELRTLQDLIPIPVLRKDRLECSPHRAGWRRHAARAHAGVPSFLSMILDVIVERKLDWARDFRLHTAVLGAGQLSAAARRRFVEEFGSHAFTFSCAPLSSVWAASFRCTTFCSSRWA